MCHGNHPGLFHPFPNRFPVLSTWQIPSCGLIRSLVVGFSSQMKRVPRLSWRGRMPSASSDAWGRWGTCFETVPGIKSLFIFYWWFPATWFMGAFFVVCNVNSQTTFFMCEPSAWKAQRALMIMSPSSNPTCRNRLPGILVKPRTSKANSYYHPLFWLMALHPIPMNLLYLVIVVCSCMCHSLVVIVFYELILGIFPFALRYDETIHID